MLDTNPCPVKKPCVSALASFLDGSWFNNTPGSQLPPGVDALPKCHTTPPERTWQSFDGTALPFTVALPQTPPKAIVIIVPGTDCVTGDFSSITDALVTKGYAVYGCENRTFSYGPGGDLQKGNPR